MLYFAVSFACQIYEINIFVDWFTLNSSLEFPPLSICVNIYALRYQLKSFVGQCNIRLTEFLVDWFTMYYNSVARHFGTKPFRPLMFRYVEAISPQTFCYTKVKVGPKTIRPQDVSVLHVSWTFQAESFQSSKRRFAPNNFGPYTFWYHNILAIFLNLWVEQGRPEEMGEEVEEERRWEERVGGEGRYSRIGY